VNPKFYMIAGISVAPIRDPKVVLFPERRMDLAGFISVPQVPGFVLTTGITDISSRAAAVTCIRWEAFITTRRHLQRII